MEREELNTILENHKLWLEREGGQRANLRGADLQHADLDFSCLPLWCGSKGMKGDRRIAIQILAHFCVLRCDDEEIKNAQETMLPLAQKCHRARELGLKFKGVSK